MAKTERIREVLTTPLSPEILRQKAEDGWRAVAVEWERDAAGNVSTGGALGEEVPYGLRVAEDCHHLAEDPGEVEAMTLMLEQIVADKPLSAAAEELNRRGFRRRGGGRWSQVSVFTLLPRLIEVAPRIYSSEDWSAKRTHLRKVIG